MTTAEIKKRIACAVAKVRTLIEKIVNQCPHEKTTFQPDCSGWSSGFSVCDVCGKYL